MDTYTLGTTPAQVIEDYLPAKYAMELSRTDMHTVLRALNCLFAHGSDPDADNAASLRTGILGTIGIEEI